MEQLISFVTHNFYFVIIVVGIIYSMFFRKSPIERPPNRMPDFGGSGRPQTQGTRPTDRRQHPQQQQHQQSQPSRQQPQQHFDNRRQESRPLSRAEDSKSGAPIAVAAAAEDAYVGASPKPARVSKAQESQSAPQSFVPRAESAGLSRDDLTRAVIWAEILGPPRARRPYRR